MAWSSRLFRSGNVKAPRRAAASSITSGTPSSRRQRSATSLSSRTAPGSTVSARSLKSLVATSTGSGPICTTRSPGTPRRSRLVARTVPPVLDSSRSATIAAPSIKCSQLSSTTTTSVEQSVLAMASRTCLPAGSTIPREAATARPTTCSSEPEGSDARSENAAGAVRKRPQGQAGLANAPRAGQGNQAVLTDGIGQLGQFILPADEGGRRLRRPLDPEVGVDRLLSGVGGQGAPVRQPELSEQGGDVALGGALRYEQRLGDLGVAEPLAHELEDLGLPRRRRQFHDRHLGLWPDECPFARTRVGRLERST